MRRRLTGYILIIMCLLNFTSVVMAQDKYSEGCLFYEIKDGSITITGCFGDDEEITVPALIAGNPVNTIAEGAFSGCKNLKVINLPDTITTVEEGAFPGGITVNYNSNTVNAKQVTTETTDANFGRNSDGTDLTKTVESKTDNADGSITVVYTDHTVETIYPDGTIKDDQDRIVYQMGMADNYSVIESNEDLDGETDNQEQNNIIPALIVGILIILICVICFLVKKKRDRQFAEVESEANELSEEPKLILHLQSDEEKDEEPGSGK